jgi:hypothetical protein
MEVFKDKSQKKGIIKRFLSNFTSQKKLKQTKSINESFVLVETTKKELLQVQEEDYLDDQLDTNEMFNYSANIETNINELPVEIICQIFSYLEVSERKNASLVCKKWRYAFLNTHFLNDVLIKANNCLFISRPSSSTVIQKSNHKNLK